MAPADRGRDVTRTDRATLALARLALLPGKGNVRTVLMRLMMWIPHRLMVFVLRVLLGFAVLVLLVGCAYLYVNWHGAKIWREYAAQSAAKGEPVDVLPPSSVLPAERNFMKTPLLDRWMFGKGDESGFVRFMEGVRLPQKEAKYTGRTGSNGWADLGWIDCAKTAEAWFGPDAAAESSAAEPDTVAARRLLAQLAPTEPLLAELRKAALERPGSELVRPAAISREQPLEIPLARFQFARGMANGLAAHGSACLRERRQAEAFGDTLAGLKLARGFCEMPDPTLVEAMIGNVLMRIALQTLWEGCQVHAWSDDELRRFEQELAAIHPVAALQRALRCDRACMLLTFDQASLRISQRPWLFWLRWPRGWVDESKVFYCDCIQDSLDMLNAARSRSFARKWGDGCTCMEHRFEALSHIDSLRLSMGVMAVPAVKKPMTSSFRADFSVSAARLACALERYRLWGLGYPEQLQLLVPGQIEALSSDVIDGQHLRYLRPKRTAYVLYSVGLNGVDDVERIGRINTKEPVETDDWCWVQLRE